MLPLFLPGLVLYDTMVSIGIGHCMISLMRIFGKCYTSKYCWIINYFIVIDIHYWLQFNSRDSLFIFIWRWMLLFEYARRQSEKGILNRLTKSSQNT